MNKFISNARGFTLIEILVVVGIIGVLSGIVMVSVGGSSANTRDAKRLSDVKTFQGALEVYFSEHINYPYTNCAGSNNWTSFDSPTYSPYLLCDSIGGIGKTLTQFMAPYISQLKDPKSLGGDSGYLYINQGGPGDFCILIWRTPENLNNFPRENIPATRCTAWDSNGKCTSGTNALYIGKGIYAGGC